MGPVVSVDALSVKNRTWVNIEAELQTSDKEVITDSSSKIISAWQFSKVHGLQPTTIVEKLEPMRDDMAQVLNCGNNHWVMMSTIGCSVVMEKSSG